MLSSFVAGIATLFSQSGPAASCGEIVIGSAITLTGKYATNGVHAQKGHEYAIATITENGGVKVGGCLSHTSTTPPD